MSYYSEPDGPTPEQEAAWDYENLREYCDSLERVIRQMVEIGDPMMDVADAVSFYEIWCEGAKALLPKPKEPSKPYVFVERDDGDPF